MKKKILFVINSLNCGGAEKSLVSLLNTIDLNQYDIDLQMFNIGGMFMSLLPKEVNVLPELPYITFCKKPYLNIKYGFTKAKTSVLLRIRPTYNGKPLHDAQIYWKSAGKTYCVNQTLYDAAIAWGQGNPTHYVAEKTNAKKKIAVINADYEVVGHNKDFDKEYYAQYNYIAGVSEKLSKKLKNTFPDFTDKVVVLHDIINEKLISKMAEEFNPYETNTSRPIIATVGRMVQPKGYDFATQAASILKNKGYSFRWYFIGDGPERPKIETLIKNENVEDCVIPVGAKDNPYPYVKNADIYVQTSRSEGFCLALAEARCLNIPPVSTAFEVVNEQIKNGENGIIVDINAQSIADGISRLLSDKYLNCHIRENLLNDHIGNENEIKVLYRLVED